MSQNYNEIICTAIDEIVMARIKDIQCDITKQCSIIDDSYSYEGKYVVSDGGAKFEAFSTDTSFRKGNNVLVTIPNGDFKSILLASGTLKYGKHRENKQQTVLQRGINYNELKR